MAVYSHTYAYMQLKSAQVVLAMALQHNHTHEAGTCYTRLIQLWCSTTQLLCRGLQHQLSYSATW